MSEMIPGTAGVEKLSLREYAEKAYLDMLSARLNLAPGLVEELNRQVASQIT